MAAILIGNTSMEGTLYKDAASKNTSLRETNDSQCVWMSCFYKQPTSAIFIVHKTLVM